jgi:LuxR family transcriptional regulator, maltose regulon positive regulatory protein
MIMDAFPLVTRTRIVVPRRRDELLTRPRLLDGLMERLGNRLVIISAPAGYGKTSLMVDFVHHLEWPACWYAIDDLDGDPLRFISHFISAIQVRFPQFGRAAQGILRASTQDRLNLDMLVAAAANDVYESIPEHFVFILDDYHLVDTSRPVNQFISRFLQTVSENCHLFIASRTLLTLPDLPLLVARNEVAGLSVDELSFQPDEIQALFLQNQRQVLPTDLANELANKTEGWIAGLLLTSQLGTGPLSTRKGTLKAAGVGLYDYLAQQVLEKQPAVIQEFLLRTALLEEFSPDFCAEVINPVINLAPNWERLLDEAQRNNLFILPVDDRSVRYHHLFLEFLQHRMNEQQPEEAAHIRVHLAKVYAEKGEWERAYRVYQRLGQLSAQVGLLEQAGPDLITSGRLNTLMDWLTGLPEHLRLERPVLLSLQGGVAINRGDLAGGEALLNQGIAGLRPDGDRYQLALALSRRSAGRRLGGRFAEALADADESLKVAMGIPGASRVTAEAQRARGAALVTLGVSRAAFEQLSQAHATFQELGDTINAARLLLEIGMAHRAQGQLDEAEVAYTQALELWEATGNLAWQSNLLNNLGVLQHERGEYLSAVHSLERAVECARLASYPRMEAFALAGLGDLYRDLEAFAESAEAYRQASVLAERVDEQYLMFYLDLARGVLARRQKQVSAARQLLTAATEQAETRLSDKDRASCQLELAALTLVQGETAELEMNLADAAAFFLRNGMRVEAARCQLILMLAAAGNGDQAATRRHHQQLVELWDSHAPWPPLVSAASEFILVLERSHTLPALEPLGGRLLRQATQLRRRLPGLRRQLRPQAGVVPMGPAHVTIQVLGRMEVRVNRRLVTGSDWRSLVARDLFFFLLDHPQGVSKEQIGLVFWPEASPNQLQQRFRNLMYRLRHAVGSEVVLLGPGEMYQFNTSLDYDYDVETFDRELELAERQEDLELKLRHLTRAIRLYQGPYLIEIDAEWALFERERLKRRCLDALIAAAALALELKRAEQALQFCQRALQIDPGMEEAHRLAMRCYATEGDRAGVIRQYQACRQTMEQDFNTDPSPQTVKLFDELTR